MNIKEPIEVWDRQKSAAIAVSTIHRPSKIVSWFSCGYNSAVASKLTLDKYSNDEVVIARCVVTNEHEDNDRFHNDCEDWLQHPIIKLASKRFADCWEVWERRRYISGINGAPCTIEMKKAVRWAFEREFAPDYQVFGFSSDEVKRGDRFREQNPEVNLLTPLIDEGISKPDCAVIMEATGIKPPVMYKMGFRNNNCIGCAKATSIVYWAKTRHYFPEEFKRMSELSRRLGCRLTRLKGVRIFLDEIPLNINWQQADRATTECSLLCAGS